MNRSSTVNIVSVILAAGASSRFNGSKITAKIQNGQSVLGHSIATLNQLSEVANIAAPVVILGAHINDDVMAITANTLRMINPHWQLGLSSSVKQAVTYAIEVKADALLLVLADQVALSVDDYVGLIEAYLQNGKTSCSYYHQDVGVPAIFIADDFTDLLSINGDKGAKTVLKRHAHQHSLNILPMENAQFDIDTPADLALWLDQQ
jgi:molybdenum cofactor cytidylyltransferase